MSKYFFLFCLTILLLGFNYSDRQSPAFSFESHQHSITSSSQHGMAESQHLAVEPVAQIQFTCGSTFNNRQNRKVPTTIAWNSLERRAIVQWVKPMGNWTPEQRCQEVSQRMQAANDAGTLKYITNGKIGGKKAICTATEVNGKCKNLLLTLRSNDKALDFLGELKDLFNGRSEGPIEHSSGEPQMYIRIDINELWKNSQTLK
jgi:Circadian oscillating protein COP23